MFSATRGVLERSELAQSALRSLTTPILFDALEIVGTEGRPAAATDLMGRVVATYYPTLARSLAPYFVTLGFAPVVVRSVKIATKRCAEYDEGAGECAVEETKVNVPFVPEFGSCVFTVSKGKLGQTIVAAQLIDDVEVEVHIVHSSLYPPISAFGQALQTPCALISPHYERLETYKRFERTALVQMAAPNIWLYRNLPANAHMQRRLETLAEAVLDGDPSATVENTYDVQDETIDVASSVDDVHRALLDGKVVAAEAMVKILPPERRVDAQPRMPTFPSLVEYHRELERVVAAAFAIPLSSLTGSAVNQRLAHDERHRLRTTIDMVRQDLVRALKMVAKIVYDKDYDFDVPVNHGVDVDTLLLGYDAGVVSWSGLRDEFSRVTGVSKQSLTAGSTPGDSKRRRTGERDARGSSGRRPASKKEPSRSPSQSPGP